MGYRTVKVDGILVAEGGTSWEIVQIFLLPHFKAEFNNGTIT